MFAAINSLQAAERDALAVGDMTARANAFHDQVLPQMAALRSAAAAAETVCGDTCWPLPSYSRMLHYVGE